MRPWPEGTRWLGAHLFFNAGIYTPECDRVVLDLAEPFVRRCQGEGWIDGYFFIRYSEYGPHVRLRLHGRDDVIEGTVWPALQEHARSLWPDVSFERPEGPAYAPFDPRADLAAEGELRVTHVARIEYEPETERYGGPEGVRVAERFFEHSSDAACALLRKTGRERSSRLGKALLSMVVLIHVFSRDRDAACDWMQQYGEGYLRAVARDEDGRSAWLGAFGSGYDSQAQTLGEYVEEVWSRMDEGEPLSEALDRYRDGLLEVRGHFRELFDARKLARDPAGPHAVWEHAVIGIGSSYIHMMSNRLGVSVQEESYLAYLIMRALGRPADAAASP